MHEEAILVLGRLGKEGLYCLSRVDSFFSNESERDDSIATNHNDELHRWFAFGVTF